MEFFEDLDIRNATCPPAAASPRNLTVYRLVDTIPMKVEDIWSYRALYPAKIFPGVDECMARACSVFADCGDLKKIRKMPKFKMKKIVAIDIETRDGVLLKTFAGSHFSWWISRGFNLTAVAVAKEAV